MPPYDNDAKCDRINVCPADLGCSQSARVRFFEDVVDLSQIRIHVLECQNTLLIDCGSCASGNANTLAVRTHPFVQCGVANT